MPALKKEATTNRVKVSHCSDELAASCRVGAWYKCDLDKTSKDYWYQKNEVWDNSMQFYE